MLTILGSKTYGGFCDHIARRDFLAIGGMALGGLALPQILRAEAENTNPQREQGTPSLTRRVSVARGISHKAIINVFLPGGPPHIDMWDLKPDAPAEIRG